MRVIWRNGSWWSTTTQSRATRCPLLAQGFDVVGEAAEGYEAIELALAAAQLVLLDLTMPGLDGLSALPGLREAAPRAEIVVLAASGTDDNLLTAIRRGAAGGYLLKSESPERIVIFLRGVARGEAALSGEVARSLLDQVRAGGRLGGGVPDAITAALSARELEVLLLLDEHLLDGRDRRPALHLRAHGSLAREELAPQARRLLAPRRARAARARPALTTITA